MDVSIDDLTEAGFARDSWPEDLPEPGLDTITGKTLDGSKRLYRYQADLDDAAYASEVTLDTATVPDPAEGVVFMLNQFAYLWRTDRAQLAVQPDGSCRRIDF